MPNSPHDRRLDLKVCVQGRCDHVFQARCRAVFTRQPYLPCEKDIGASARVHIKMQLWDAGCRCGLALLCRIHHTRRRLSPEADMCACCQTWDNHCFDLRVTEIHIHRNSAYQTSSLGE